MKLFFCYRWCERSEHQPLTHWSASRPMPQKATSMTFYLELTIALSLQALLFLMLHSQLIFKSTEKKLVL